MKTILIILLFLSLNISLYSNNICNVELTNSIDFGKVQIRSISEKQIILFNNSNKEVFIYDIKIESYFKEYLEIDKFDLPLVIPSNSGFNFNVRLNAKQNINFKAAIFIQIGCEETRYSLPITLSSNIVLTEGGEFDITNNRWGADLLDAMFLNMNSHTVFSYANARQLFWGNFDKVDGLVECVYTGKTIDPGETPNFSALDAAGFNTEHTWPRSLGADNEPPVSDINHLFVTDKTTNDRRANHPFGNVSTVTYENGGSKLGKDASGNTVFEVRDKYRGNIARAMFYFAVRYSNPNNFLNSQEETLRQWAIQDPVDQKESARNDSVAKYQRKSNLFIQFPELINRIPSISLRNDVEYSIDYSLSDTGLVYHLAFVPNNASSKFYVSNYNFSSTKVNHTASISSIDVEGNNQDFELIYSTDKMEIEPNSYKEIEVICKAISPADAKVSISFTNGLTKSINLRAQNPILSVRNKLHDIKVFNYPNPALNSTKIVLEGIADKELIQSAKVYDLLSGEVADLSDKYQISGNDFLIDFDRQNASIDNKVYFVRITLKSGKSIMHPIMFLN